MLPACIAQFFASSVSLITSGLASAAPGRRTSPRKTLHPDVLVGAISFLLLRVGSGAHSLRAPAPTRCRDAPFLASQSDFIPARKKMHPSRGTFRPPAGGVPKPNNRAPALYQKGASHPRARPPRDRAKLSAPSLRHSPEEEPWSAASTEPTRKPRSRSGCSGSSPTGTSKTAGSAASTAPRGGRA